MRRRCVIVVVLWSSIAAAQPRGDPMSPPPPVPGEPVSENVALALSLGGTVTASGLLAGGLAIGGDKGMPLLATGALALSFAPSFGHWYAHRAFPVGLKIRAAAGGVVVIGGMLVFAECGLDTTDCTPPLAISVVLAGVGLYLGGAVYDIVTARAQARTYNQRFVPPRVALVPSVTRDGGGLVLAGTF